MMNVPENELFSAYLDGELTAAEQAEMERLLATSPAARQLLEELRALSATLQSLPVHKLNEDLSQHVLRMAERRMLSGQTESDPFSPRPVPSTGRWRALASRLSRPRVWIWPAAAVCAAILLAVLLPDRGDRLADLPVERHIVMAPAPRAPAEEPSIGPVTGATKGVALERRSAGEVAESEREHLVRGKEPAAKLSRLATVKKDEAVGNTLRLAATPAAPAAAPMATAPTAPPPPASAAGPAAKMDLAAPAVEAAKLAESKPAEVPARPMKGAKAEPAYGVPFAEEGPLPAAQESPEEVWIVRCDVTAESLTNGAFQRVLTGRQIRLRGAWPQDAQADLELNYAGRQLPRMMKEKSEVWRDADRAEPSDKPAEPLGRMVRLDAEATLAQLNAALADLRSRPTVVVSQPEVVVLAGGVAFGQSFFGKAGAAKQPADAFQTRQTEGQSQQLHTKVYPQADMKKAAAKPATIDETLNVQITQNQRNQPSLAESAAGAASSNQMQNVQSRAGVDNAIRGGGMASQAQVNQSRSSFGMRQQRLADAETRRRGDAVTERGGEGERGRRGDAETGGHGDLEKRKGGAAETAGKEAGPGAGEPGRSAGTGMADLGGKAADRKEAQAEQRVEEAPSQAPAMPGMPALQQAAPVQRFGAMPGGQPTHSRPLKAKSQVGAYVDQEASQAEGRRRVVFFLRVVDAGQIAAEKSGKSQAGQAKAAMMDAARAAPVEARIAAPAKPAASTPPAAASKK